MKFVCTFVLLVLSISCCSASPAVPNNVAHRPDTIESIVKQLEIVNGNLNQLHLVLGALAHEYETLDAPTAKSDQFAETIDNALSEVDNVQKVVDAVKEQLTGLSLRSPRTRRSVQLNEANLEELSQLISLLRNGPHAGNTRRVRRQANDNIIGNIGQTVNNSLSDLLMLATNLSNGIRRRLNNISQQITDLTNNSVTAVGNVASNTVQGAANVIGNIGNSAAGTMNTVTSQITNAITNGVNQVNTIAQNTIG